MPAIDKERISKWINRIVVAHNCNVGEISIVFCSDNYLLSINQQYLKHDYHTDVITFDYVNNQIISGDILISLETVKSNAERYKVSFKEELHRVIIHGLLHLLGINDKTNAEQKVMTEKENESLLILSKIN